MRKVKVQELSEKFAVYGRYAKLLNPAGQHLGASPIRFYRDLLPLKPRTGIFVWRYRHIRGRWPSCGGPAGPRP